MARPSVYDDDLRTRLLDAAASAIADGGVEALSMRAVATHAGTSTNAVYTLFGGKDPLVAAVLEQARSGFTQAQQAAVGGIDGFGDLYGLGVAYREWALAHPTLYAVLMGGRLHGNGLLADEHWAEDLTVQPLLGVVRRAVAAGDINGVAEDVATMLWAGVHGMVSLEIALWGGRSRVERDRVFDALMASLGSGWGEPAVRT